MDKAQKAAIEYRDLKDRKIHPEGSFDKQGRFYLDEKYNCCNDIRSPSRRFPYSEMLHGRTKIHVANKYNVDVKDINKALKVIQ